MIMKFVLRNGNLNDIGALAACHFKCFVDAHQDILPQPLLDDFQLPQALKHWRSEFVAQAEDEDRGIFVLEAENNRIIGFANCGAAQAKSSNSLGQGEIFSLFVEADYQGFGLGKALMLAASRWLICRGLFSGGMWVVEDNGIGRRFCEDLGARNVARRRVNSKGYQITKIGLSWADFSEVAQLECEVPQWGTN